MTNLFTDFLEQLEKSIDKAGIGKNRLNQMLDSSLNNVNREDLPLKDLLFIHPSIIFIMTPV